jgi:hypothetical protein
MGTRIIKIILPLVIGAALGLIYGWRLDPIEYVEVTPEILRADYRADYVLTVAEAFSVELDEDTAAQRLGLLGDNSPAQIAVDALEYSRSQAFNPDEIRLLETLSASMQTYTPGSGDNLP